MSNRKELAVYLSYNWNKTSNTIKDIKIRIGLLEAIIILMTKFHILNIILNLYLIYIYCILMENIFKTSY